MSIQSIISQAIKNYPVFEGSQVLTSSQLNNLFGYLDQQDRFTRARLIGIGILCGLDVRAVGDEVELSEGMGITSDGFLIKMPQCTMSYYRNYELPVGVIYEPFGFYDDNDIFTQDSEIQLYELLSKKPETGEHQDLDQSFFNDKYMLLYLECFDRDPRSCLGKNCEDLGRERIFTLRKLVVNQAGLNKILGKADAGVDNPFYTVSTLNRIDLQRPIFQPDGDESKLLTAFTQNYLNKIFSFENADKPFDLLFGGNRATGLLHQTYEEYQPVLEAVYDYQNPLSHENSRFSAVKSGLRSFFGGSDISSAAASNMIGIQYVYEYIEILVRAIS